MSVQPPTFPELVAEASVVARVRVVAVESRAVSNSAGRRTIKTFVTFATLASLKGAAPPSFSLAFLGGEAEGERWTIPGMPTFSVGDEEFIFSTGRESICPLVAAMHGRYRVLHDPTDGHAYVARDNLEPLTTTDHVGAPLDARTIAASPASALRPEEFSARITHEIERPSRAKLQP